MTSRTAPSQSGLNAPQGPPTIIDGKKIYKVRGVTVEVDKHFEIIKAVGFGAYGIVCSAKNLQTGSFVAVKKVPKLLSDLADAKRVLREVTLLRMLKHPNILDLHCLLVPRESKETFQDLYMVSELLPTDLQLVMKSKKQDLSEDHRRYFSYQLLRCLAFLHKAGVMHRDLKPSNMLLDGNCSMKLCDFGLARAGVPFPVIGDNGDSDRTALNACEFTPGHKLLGVTTPNYAPLGVSPDTNTAESASTSTAATKQAKEEQLTDYVITRWYRPPELLLMSSYAHSVDIWSAGCIMAEMLAKKVLFQGKDYVDQLVALTDTIPIPPNDDEVAKFVEKPDARSAVVKIRNARRTAVDCDASDEEIVRIAKENLRNRMPMIDLLLLDLLGRLLVFNPAKRLTASEALKHRYFKQIYEQEHEQDYEKWSNRDTFNHFTWDCDNKEINEAKLRELFWREILQYSPQMTENHEHKSND